MAAEQEELEGMPEAKCTFDGVPYRKFQVALGGAGDIPVADPMDQQREVEFRGRGKVVATKLQAGKGLRTDIIDIDQDSFEVVYVEAGAE
jgi:hypothetical protein